MQGQFTSRDQNNDHLPLRCQFDPSSFDNTSENDRSNFVDFVVIL